MNQTILLLDTETLIKQFIDASKNANTKLFDEILDEYGSFEIEDEKFKIIDASKKDFLIWYTAKIKEITITDIIYDQCIGCCFGKNIVIFNHGTFPRLPQEFTDKTKAGLMLDSRNGKIHKIQFCFSFLKTENRAVCECVGNEYLKYMKAGFSEDDAIAMYNDNPNSEYSYITKKIEEEENDGLSF